jgi:hypothetical protein
LPRCTACGKRPQTEDDALPQLRRPLVARSRLARHHQLWDGSRRPLVGGGAACCNGTPHKAPRPEGSALTLALAGCQPASRKRLWGIAGERVARSNYVDGGRGRVRQDVRRHQPKPQHQGNSALGQRHPGRLKPASPPRSRPHRLARLAALVRTNAGRPGVTRSHTHSTTGQHQAGSLVDRCGPADPGPRWRG